MNAIALIEAARLVLETMAEVEGVSVEQMQAAYQAGDESVSRMFDSYLKATIPTIEAVWQKLQAA